MNPMTIERESVLRALAATTTIGHELQTMWRTRAEEDWDFLASGRYWAGLAEEVAAMLDVLREQAAAYDLPLPERGEA